MKKLKPHHVSKLCLFVNVETSYDQDPESKASLLLNAARMLDKNYVLEIVDMGPVERISKKVEEISVKPVISGDNPCINK